jgi:hypothetical protein
MALYDGSQVTPLDFGPDIPFAFLLSMNNQGIISVTTSIEGLGDRGFRFDPRTGQATLLNPLSTEPNSWVLGINNHGDILGYSFILVPPNASVYGMYRENSKLTLSKESQNSPPLVMI